MQREREKEERAAEGKEGWSLTDQQEDGREKRPPENPKSTGSPPGPASSIHCRKGPQQLWLLKKKQAAIKLMTYYPRRRKQLGYLAPEIKQTLFPSKKIYIYIFKLIQLEKRQWGESLGSPGTGDKGLGDKHEEEIYPNSNMCARRTGEGVQGPPQLCLNKQVDVSFSFQ